MIFPDADDETTRRLVAEAGVVGEEAAARLAASVLSAIVAYMIAGLGAEKTSEILRDWAAKIMRRELT